MIEMANMIVFVQGMGVGIIDRPGLAWLQSLGLGGKEDRKMNSMIEMILIVLAGTVRLAGLAQAPGIQLADPAAACSGCRFALGWPYIR